MPDPHFFGYGSLVNVSTHAYRPVHAARLTGWRRTWRSTPGRVAAFLTATPDAGSIIEGLIAPVPGGDWAALDLRETGYDRVPAPHVAHAAGDDVSVSVYAVPEARAGGAPLPVLLSYIDVVIQGYLQVFGEAGAVRFFETTDGWEHPVADDRAAPLYSRSRNLAPDERGIVDAALLRIGAHVLPVDTFGLGPVPAAPIPAP